METYREKFSKPDNDLFLDVPLPNQLQNRHLLDKDENTVTRVLKLRRCTRYWLKEVFIFFTEMHRKNISYYGAFGIDDIIFEGGRVHVRRGPAERLFSRLGCTLDYKSLRDILKELKNRDGDYSQYFLELLGYLDQCPAGAASRSDIAISFLINHPAIEHYFDRVKQIMLMDNILFRIFANPNISSAHKHNLTKAMGNTFNWWANAVTCQEMNKVLIHRSYESQGMIVYNPLFTDDPIGCFHYSNNFFKHADNNLDIEAMEAAYSINLPDFLPIVLERITCYAVKSASFAQQFGVLLDLVCNDLADPHSTVS